MVELVSPSKKMVSSDKRADGSEADAAPVPTNVEGDASRFTHKALRLFTPRSKEAMRQCGVLKEDIVRRSVESFAERGVAREIQKLRFEVNEQNRHESLHMVRAQRKELVKMGWAPLGRPSKKMARSASAPAMGRTAPSMDLKGLTPLQTDKTNSPTGKSYIQKQEEKRVQKILFRQQKEMQTLMAYEVNLAQTRAKQERKTQLRKEKEEEQKRIRREEAQKVQEKRDAWIKLKEQEEVERQQRRVAEDRARKEKEKRTKELQEEKDAERTEEHRQKQNMRMRKKADLERRNKHILEQQMRMFERKSREMEIREIERSKQILAKKRAQAELNAERTAQANARVQEALDQSERVLDERRRELETRMQSTAERLAEFNAQKAQRKIEKLKEARKKEKKRQEAQKAAYDKHMQMIRDREKRKAAQEKQRLANERQKMEELEFRSELARLNRQRKQQNIDRLKRIEDHRRQQLIAKVNSDARRAKDLEMEKTQLLLDRQNTQMQADRNRREMLKIFEDLNKTGAGHNIKKLKEMGLEGLAVTQELDTGRSTKSNGR